MESTEVCHLIRVLMPMQEYPRLEQGSHTQLKSAVAATLAETTSVDAPPTATNDTTMVWVDDTAKRYHKKNGCGMDNAYQVTLDEAIAMGKTPCGRCYK